MKRQFSYALRREDEGLRRLSLERIDEGRWRLLDSDQTRASHPGAVVLPGSIVQTGIAKLPRLRGGEMLRALKAWAARESEIPLDDLAISWRILDENESGREGKVDVFYAHCSQKLVDETLADCEKHGLRPEILLPDFLVIDQLLRTVRPEIAGLDAWSFVHLGEHVSFICVATPRALLLHRTVPMDSAQCVGVDEHVERLVTGIQRSIHRVRQSKANLAIEALFLSGEEDLLAPLAEKLRSSQEAEVSVWRIADLIESEAAPFAPEAMIPAAAALLASMGAANFNLLPERRKGLPDARTVRRLSVAAAVLAAMLVPLAVGGSLLAERRSSRQVETMKAELETMKPAIAEAEAIDLRWRSALERERVVAEQGRETEGLELVLADLALRTPAQIRLKNLKVLHHGDAAILQIGGESRDDKHADAQEAFLAFVASLEDSELLSRGELPGQLRIEEIESEEGEGEVPMESIRRKQVVFSLEYRITRTETQGSRS